MAVTKEEGGRLNAFAKEPEIEILDKGSSDTKAFRIFLFFGILLLMGLIAYTFTMS